MKDVFFLLSLSLFFISCSGQNETIIRSAIKQDSLVGGGCDGCELMYVSMPKHISNTHTSVGWNGKGQKLLIEGIVYKLDGITPASDVILYYWHTDETGLYRSDKNTASDAVKHGKLRGWVKTSQDGTYQIKTSRPAPYPNEDIPCHIHISVKEPDIPNEYYLDWYFDDDKLYLNHRKKYGKFDRGGTEILRVLVQGDTQIVEHNVMLGLNIPDYPAKPSNHSGLYIGEDQPSFVPYHAYGPDAGKRTCPVCKYGRYHGIVMFVGNDPNWIQIEKWLEFLEKQSHLRRQYLKAYFVYGDDQEYSEQNRREQLVTLGKKLNIKYTALTFVPSWNDTETEAHLNQINPKVRSTLIIYKHRTIVHKLIDLSPDENNFAMIKKVLDNTQGLYFGLTGLQHH